MPAVTKDFDKEVTDFFKANSGFKYESRAKGEPETVYINPSYDKGVLTVNTHYDVKAKCRSILSKVSLSDNDTIASKVVVDASKCGQKVEFNNKTNTHKWNEYSGDIIHQIAKKDFCFFVKSAYSHKARTNADIQLSVAVHKHLQIGTQVVFNYLKKVPDTFKLAVRYSCCQNNVLALSVDNKGTKALSAYLNLKDMLNGRNVATFLRMLHGSSGVAVHVGLQHLCPVTGTRIQAKADTNQNFGLSLQRRFRDISVQVGGSAKLGKGCCPLSTSQAFVELSRS